MADDTPTDRLAELPLFPLGTVLFPDGLLPLQIFEVRYLDMVRRCHREGTPFGVVHLTEGHEVRKPGQSESFSEVGTLAQIEHMESPQAGLILVRCVGTQRFRLSRSEQRPHGLWVGEATLIAPDLPVPVPDDLREVAHELQMLIERLQAQIRAQVATQAGPDADVDPLELMPLRAPWRFDDCGWVANRWCDLMRMPMQIKQRLLALDNPLLRLELVSDLLARASRKSAG